MPLTQPLIVPAIRLDRDADAEARMALERARRPWVAGFILFGGEAEQVANLTAQLRDAAGRPIFIASDMERGAGQQVKGLTRLPDFGILGLAGTPLDAMALGDITAREAMSVGIDVIFGPCLDVRSEMDNPILGNRSFGFDPERVAELGCGFVTGVRQGGALPVAKHFPGHGATREDSHDTIPTVAVDALTLEARDLPPFHKALWWGGCPGVMAAHVSYPALDPSGAIATFSKPILDRVRAMPNPNEEDPGVLVFTDAMMMAGATVPGGEPEAALRARAAGCDMLLYPEEPEAIAAALSDDADGERAVANLTRFLAEGAMCAARGEAARSGTAAVPERLAQRAVAMAGGPYLGPDLLVLVDDDGIEERGDVLAAAAADEDVPVVRLRVGEDTSFAVPAVEPEFGGFVSVTVVAFAQARAWKGGSGVSAACRTLVDAVRQAVHDAEGMPNVIWCAPRGDGFADTLIPGNGPQVEGALAARLFPDLETMLADAEGRLPDEA